MLVFTGANYRMKDISRGMHAQCVTFYNSDYAHCVDSFSSLHKMSSVRSLMSNVTCLQCKLYTKKQRIFSA